MDDECAEELGRPISSLKVAELRDELTKRALIKTGNKKELIDRLRQAILRQSSTEQSGAADLSLRPADSQPAQPINNQVEELEHGEEAIDYSSPEKTDPKQIRELTGDSREVAGESSEHSPEQCQDATTPIVEEQSLISDSRDPKVDMHSDENLGATKELEHLESHQPEIEDEEVDRRIQAETEENDSKQHPEQFETRSERLDVQTTDTSINDDQLTRIEGETVAQSSVPEVVDTKHSADTPLMETAEDPVKSATAEPNFDSQQKSSVTRVPFTLKRRTSDLKDSSISSKSEKRRKWSGKSESQDSENPQTVLSRGISSQKLQELIESKKTDKGRQKKDKSERQEKNNEFVRELDQSVKEAAAPKVVETNPEITEQEVIPPSDGHKRNTESGEKTGKTDVTENVREGLNNDEADESKEPTNGLLVENLVRPFTIQQLKEALSQYGAFTQEKFWTDKVKSKCCVLYDNTEIAQQTRLTLNGQHWPASNPKTLKISYITEDEFAHLQQYDTLKKKEFVDNSINGANDQSGKSITNRLGEKEDENGVGGGQVKKRLGDKVSSDTVNTKSSNINRSNNSQPQELDDLFRKTRSKPSLFWLPLTDEQAEVRQKERKERDARRQELTQKSSRRSPPHRRRSPPRRTLVRHRSPARRSPPRRRTSSSRRISPRRRSPSRSSPAKRRSPVRRSRSPVRRSPGQLRRSPVPTRRSPLLTRRSPGLVRRSPGPIRRSPGPIRRSPGPIRRSPGPARRSPLLSRRSPGPVRRSPGPVRRSPGPVRRSPGPVRRSPGPIRRSPGFARRSPGLLNRSPGPIRRTTALPRRSPGPVRRSPVRRSPAPIRRSPGPIRRSPMITRRSPAPVRVGSPVLLSRSRSISRNRSRSPVRRRSPFRRRSPGRYASPEQDDTYAAESRRIQRLR